VYPALLRHLLRRAPRKLRVFVAMSFEEHFATRYNNVIEPAIRSLEANGVTLEPHRVDRSVVSDSILTEIIDGVTNDLLVFVDLTTIGTLDSGPVRNANVLYELGLAHAIRLPQDVVLFRSDADRLLFDLSDIRVRHYDPDVQPDVARQMVAEALKAAADGARLVERAQIAEAVRSVDFIGWNIIWALKRLPQVSPQLKDAKTVMTNPLAGPSLLRLLELDLVECRIKRMFGTGPGHTLKANTEDLFDLVVTPVGDAVLLEFIEQSGLSEVLNAAIAGRTEPPAGA